MHGRFHSFKMIAISALSIALGTDYALAQKQYDVGISDTEIKIGNIMPYSGPASGYAAIGKTEAAYFKMINDQGGVNGRKITFISYDDAYSPPKTVEQTRKLVESDEVFLLFNIFGTPGNVAIHKYVNQKKIPHLFISSGAERWADYANYPWSMSWWPSIRSEARVYAKYIQQNFPEKTIGILYQNDDFGKDYLASFYEAFGAEAKKKIVIETPYEVSSPTIDSQVLQIKAAKVDIFINLGSQKFGAQAMKKAGELGWQPIQFLSSATSSIPFAMRAAGKENAKNVISATHLKDPADPKWKDDEAIKRFRAFMTKYYSDGDQESGATVFGYDAAKALVQVLAQCGDNLTRANVMKQMTSLDMEVDIHLPGIIVKTSPTNYRPISQLQLIKFNGERFETFGPIIDGN